MTSGHVELLIIGAGPTGLGAAQRLAEQRPTSWRVLEATDHVGGLARSITDETGFTYDIGGHVLFSHYPEHAAAVEAALDGQFTEIQRRAAVWTHGRHIPYPFQLNLRHLDPHVVHECVAGLIRAQRTARTVRTFEDWVVASFGEGIARHFMRPYNRKVWATDLGAMSAGWIAERVAEVDVDQVLRHVLLGEDPQTWGPNQTFRYPLRGGTGAIYEAMAHPLRDAITLNCPVITIDAPAHTVTTADGDVITYTNLLSTAPLDVLVRMCTTCPPKVRAAAASLRAIGTDVVGVALAGAAHVGTGARHTWVYYPAEDVPFHRLTYLSDYSPHMTPERGQSLLLAETSRPPGVLVDPHGLIAEVVDGLVRCGAIPDGAQDQVVHTWHHHAVHSYPVPTTGRDQALAVIEPWLQSHGIASRGRFGSWRYEIGNMDHAWMQGREWVDRVLHDRDEGVWQPTRIPA